jgi:hypothetical protein
MMISRSSSNNYTCKTTRFIGESMHVESVNRENLVDSTLRVSSITVQPVALPMRDPHLLEKHVASSPKCIMREELPADLLTISPTLSGRRSPRYVVIPQRCDKPKS